jgi:pimeloyl-ACP methyl ester carboxylesterase
LPLVNVDDRAVHVIDRGSGDPIVFLHAFPLNAAMWEYQYAALEDRYRVVGIDLPGFGGSPVADDPRATTMDGLADLVAGALAAIGVGQAIVTGLSMGGYLAFALARRHPDLLRALVLADTRAMADDSETWHQRDDQQQRIEQGDDLAAMAKGLIDDLLGPESLKRQDLVDWVLALITANTAEGWIAALQAMKNRDDSLSALRDIAVPALVLVGERDRITRPTDLTLIAGRLRDSRLTVIPSAGHLSNLENPIAFNEAMEAFLAELDGAGGEDAGDQPA